MKGQIAYVITEHFFSSRTKNANKKMSCFFSLVLYHIGFLWSTLPPIHIFSTIH
jgi:hypothetical protein